MRAANDAMPPDARSRVAGLDTGCGVIRFFLDASLGPVPVIVDDTGGAGADATCAASPMASLPGVVAVSPTGVGTIFRLYTTAS